MAYEGDSKTMFEEKKIEVKVEDKVEPIEVNNDEIKIGAKPKKKSEETYICESCDTEYEDEQEALDCCTEEDSSDEEETTEESEQVGSNKWGWVIVGIIIIITGIALIITGSNKTTEPTNVVQDTVANVAVSSTSSLLDTGMVMVAVMMIVLFVGSVLMKIGDSR
jgi:hypothetical protein